MFFFGPHQSAPALHTFKSSLASGSTPQVEKSHAGTCHAQLHHGLVSPNTVWFTFLKPGKKDLVFAQKNEHRKTSAKVCNKQTYTKDIPNKPTKKDQHTCREITNKVCQEEKTKLFHSSNGPVHHGLGHSSSALIVCFV